MPEIDTLTLDDIEGGALQVDKEAEQSQAQSLAPPEDVSVSKFSSIMHRILTLAEQESATKLLYKRLMADIESRRERIMGWYGLAMDNYAQSVIGKKKPRREQILGVGEFSLKRQAMDLNIPDHTKDPMFNLWCKSNDMAKARLIIEDLTLEQCEQVGAVLTALKTSWYKIDQPMKPKIKAWWKATITKDKPKGTVPPGCSVKDARDKLYFSRTGKDSD